jgi:molybdate transport system substrate-binding protein
MLRMTKRLLVATLAVGSTLAPGARAAADAERPILFAAAASLRSVLPDLIAAFQDDSGRPAIRVSYGASDALRAQVEAGAPVDAVLFAAPQDVDELVEKGLAERATRRVIATNTLVLIGPREGTAVTFQTLTALPADARVAIGDPRSVPAGRYAKQALEALGEWDALAPRMVFGSDVTGVLSIVRRGEAVAGFVYETDARGVAEVKVLERAVGPWAPRVELVAAVIAGAANADGARRFLEFVSSPRGRAAFAEHGFGAPPDAAP